MDPEARAKRKEMRERIKRANKALSLDSMIRDDRKRYPSLSEALTSPGFWIVVSYRLSNWLSHHHLDFLGMILQLLNLFIFNCDISRRATIGSGCCIYHPMGIFIGPMVIMGSSCTIGPHIFIGAKKKAQDPEDYPILGNSVVLGAAAQLYGGIVVGDSVKIGPGAILFKDVPEGHLIFSPNPRAIKREVWNDERFNKKNW